jgi:hypothetical protein
VGRADAGDHCVPGWADAGRPGDRAEGCLQADQPLQADGRGDHSFFASWRQ